MKIQYTVTVEVNEADWAYKYDLEPSAARNYATDHLGYLMRSAVERIPEMRNGLATLTGFSEK
jgi:hypothetical protein